MRRTVPLILLLLLMPFIPQPLVWGRDASTISTVIIDGDIKDDDPTYTRDAGSNDILVYYNTRYRGFIEWNTSSIPDAAIIDSVKIRIRSYSSGYTGNTEFWSMENRPSSQANTDAGNKVIFDDARQGTKYCTSGAGSINTWYTFAFGAAAKADLQSHLADNWFSVGMYAQPGLDTYYASETAYDPEIIVQWHLATDYTFYFNDAIYENNTDAGSVTVTAHTANGSEDFTVDGADWWYGPELPDTFSWDIGGGYSRYLFSYGPENFTVTIPESTFYVYSFTIKDHTGRTGLGECFLEAYRAISGTETLIERMKIYLGNAVPLNLVYGKTYHLKVLFADGSRYDWGYFMAGGVDEINLILKAVTFTDQAQILFNHIHVEATRTATVVTVNYLDDRDNTVWANTTIRIRNGAVVLSAPRSNSSYTVNWGGADADTGYTVTVAGLHTDYGTWGRSFILDPDETFPDPPSLTGIFGDVDPNFIPWVITMISLLTFSVAFRARGLVATMFIASILNYLGWASWGYEWLAFGWFIAVGVALTAGGRE